MILKIGQGQYKVNGITFVGLAIFDFMGFTLGITHGLKKLEERKVKGQGQPVIVEHISVVCASTRLNIWHRYI